MSMNNNPVSRHGRSPRVPDQTQDTTPDARLGARDNMASHAPPNAPPARHGRRSGNDRTQRPQQPLQQWVPRATQPASGAQAAGPSHMPSPLRLPPARQAVLLGIEQWRQSAVQQAANVSTSFSYSTQEGEFTKADAVDLVAGAIRTAVETGASELLIDMLPALTLPEQIGKLSHLKRLAVRATECRQLPNSIGDLSGLQQLVLVQNNGVTLLPDRITNLQELQVLQALYMPLLALPERIGDMKGLTMLSLSGGSYEALPASFARLPRLQTLEITYSSRQESVNRQGRGGHRRNGLGGLPENFGTLQSLRTLKLSQLGQFAGLPDSFCDLGRLRDLTISYCPRVTSLPSRFGDLHGLQKLNLSRNVGLVVLPDSLGRLSGLEELDLHGNKNLTGLPEVFGWRRLTKLNLEGCEKLAALPAGLHGLPALRELNLTGCRRLSEGELNALILSLHPHCTITMPSGEVRLGGSAPPLPVRVPRAGPSIPAYQPAVLPRAEHGQLQAWKNRLAPVSGEDVNNRFSQWMEAICSQGLSDTNRFKMNRILDAVVDSEAFRSKAFTFAATHVQLERNTMGMTRVDAQPETFQGVRHMYNLLLEHQLPGMEGAAARQAIAEALPDHHRYLRDRVLDPFRSLVGDSPEEAQAMRLRRQSPQKPWGPLVAYVQAHDPEGRNALESAGKVMERLGNYASDEPYGQGTGDEDALRGPGSLPGGSGVVRYDSFRAEGTSADIDEHSYNEMVQSVQQATDMALHGRYVDVAIQLLSQDGEQGQGHVQAQAHGRARRRAGRPPRPGAQGSGNT